MEKLSEHQCEEWLEGYLLTGGHGLYKEEGTITTPFAMTVLNDRDRFHLVMGLHRRRAADRRQGCSLETAK